MSCCRGPLSTVGDIVTVPRVDSTRVKEQDLGSASETGEDCLQIFSITPSMLNPEGYISREREKGIIFLAEDIAWVEVQMAFQLMAAQGSTNTQWPLRSSCLPAQLHPYPAPGEESSDCPSQVSRSHWFCV